MTPEPPSHPALAVIDQEIAALKASKCEYQREAANLDNRALLLGALRAKVEKALIAGGVPRPSGKAPRARRRTKAEIAAAREKTVAATADAGLVKPMGYAEAKAEALARGDTAFDTQLAADREGKVATRVAYPDAVAVPPEMRRG